MRTLTAKSVLDGVLRRSGGGALTADTATAAEIAKFFDYIADRLRTAWEFFPWLETFTTEERYFRAEWAAPTTYAEGDEIRFEDSDGVVGYYTPNADDLPAAGESPDTDPDKWETLTEFRRLVEFEQTGETEFEGVAAAWDADPDATPGAKPIEFKLAGDGVVIPPGAGALASVWLKIVKKCEDFACVLWEAGAAYPAGSRVFYLTTEECYEVVTTTTAGETPESASPKFRVMEFPYILGRAVKAGALADWMRDDGQTEAADGLESQFYRLLEEQRTKLITTQGQRGRIAFRASR
jgi:hypothetical protein